MKRNFVKALLCLVMAPIGGMAQNPELDPGLFEDEPLMLDPEFSNIDRQTRATETPLPDHVNNAATKYFPPVFNQAGGSCSAASRIGYMFTHEMNAYRGTDGSLMENRYPTHFVWLMENGNSGKYAFVQQVGVPNAKVYGGITFSHRFGNQTAYQNNFGWMQGYDKWYSGMFNKMLMPTHLPGLKKEEGRIALKRWLYNHNGDSDFHCGGIAGVGVGINGNWGTIPSTAQNDEIKVTGKKFVKSWGKKFNHALTIVGYDDRIEFDLDGNGIKGEKAKDEVGAWILVNSWGTRFANNGFIYCPYANAVKTTNGANAAASWWFPEILRVRKNYRPLRTIKVKMDYSRRSEICLNVGISADLNATQPERMITLAHFEYAGDGHNGKTNPAPNIPMLGKWTDGLHHEPMEFGYDLTDLSAEFNTNTPLKYFFIVNTRDWAQGAGKIYNASIIDYEYNKDGVEVPFEIQTGGMDIQNAGATTILSTVVSGENYLEPQNIAINGSELVWDAPMASAHTIVGYNIYGDHVLLGSSSADVRHWTISQQNEANLYEVSAVYENKIESEKVSIAAAAAGQQIKMNHSGFTVPNIFNAKYQQATVEFWLRPNSLANYNQGGGPGWSRFKFHSSDTGAFVVGWDQTNRIEVPGVLQVGTWSHIAFVVDNNRIRLYHNGKKINEFTSATYSGIGGFGDFDFGAKEVEKNIDGDMAEIRIWNTARTAEEIAASYKVEYRGTIMPQHLLTYYKGGVSFDKDNKYLIDYAGKNHALFLNKNNVVAPNDLVFSQPTSVAEPVLQICVPGESIYCGMPVRFSANYPETVNNLCWQVGTKKYYTREPFITFDKIGKQSVVLTSVLSEGKTISAQCEVNVEMTAEPVASFKISKQNVSPNEPVTFVADQPLLGYKYEWEMPGAVTETSSSPNACTSYLQGGTYLVRLTVTSPSGQKKTFEQQIAVVEQAPVADFEISPAVIIKGQTVSFEDKSKNTPTRWTWLLENDKTTYRFFGQQTSVKPTVPGVYDVTLNVENAKGANSKTLQHGLIVCNADSESGLFFADNNESVRLAKTVFANAVNEATVDWWMNPTSLKDNCNGIGKSGSFLLTTGAKGAMCLDMGANGHFQTPDNFVIASEWHHYAVVVSSENVTFYRDGILFTTTPLTQPVQLAAVNGFTIGGVSAPFAGQIDEFRIWNSALAQETLQQYANQPIENIAEAKQQNNLSVYYDFNQSGGDVVDRTGNGFTGTRVGFGPDGDAWGFSQGVFCLNFNTTDAEDFAMNVSAGYYTLYLPYASVMPQGVTAYAAESVENNLVKLVAVAGPGETLAKEVPVILNIEDSQNASANTYVFEHSAEIGYTAEQNLLRGSSLDQYVSPAANCNAYVLGVHEGETKMLKAMLNLNSAGQEGKSHFLNRAHKAYLEVPMKVAENTQALRLIFKGETTGLEDVEISKLSEVIYDLQGRRVLKIVTPGLYVINGKIHYINK